MTLFIANKIEPYHLVGSGKFRDVVNQKTGLFIFE